MHKKLCQLLVILAKHIPLSTIENICPSIISHREDNHFVLQGIILYDTAYER